MPKSLTKKQYCDYIKSMMGGAIVDLELESELPKFVDIAFLKIKRHIGTTKYMTLPLSESIDLSDMNVYNVVSCFRSKPIINGTTNPSNLDSDALLFNPGWFNFYNNLLGLTATDSVAITLMTSQVINQATGHSSDIDFDFDDGILYIDTDNVGSQDITIEYIPDYQDVSEITEVFWQNYILYYALALTKIATGRARSKYKTNNLPYELDGDALISEGTQELETLNNKLEELDDIDYFLD